MLTPIYLTTNQSEECPQAGRTSCNPLPHPVSKNLSLKAIREFGPFEHKPPVLLAWPHDKMLHFPSPRSGVSKLAVLHMGEQTQV